MARITGFYLEGERESKVNRSLHLNFICDNTTHKVCNLEEDLVVSCELVKRHLS